MATSIEISYFNSFWAKTVNKEIKVPPVVGVNEPSPVWPGGYPYNELDPISVAVGAFPKNAVDDIVIDNGDIVDYNWVIEESRIRGGYNNTMVDLGVKAYIVEDDSLQQNRFNSLIYSGIYNSRTGVNNTNQFSVAEDITKSLDPINGSIQKLFSEDTNMTVFQESKTSRALIDKDAIYSAEGGGTVTSSTNVIGQITPYLGEFGISRNPESFAVYGFQKYFTDVDRGVVLRLSRDGITEISKYGMLDYFRDNLVDINDNDSWTVSLTPVSSGSEPAFPTDINILTEDISRLLIGMQISVNGSYVGNIFSVTPTGITGGIITVDRVITPVVTGDNVSVYSIAPSKALGGFDIHNRNYILSLQKKPQYTYDTTLSEGNYATLAFDELINGWSSFLTYKPTTIFSLKNKFYSTQYGNTWKHYSGIVDRTSFYGVYGGANITFVFNVGPSINKVFKTINYEGDNGWQVDSIISEPTGYDLISNTWRSYGDTAGFIPSYVEGVFTDQGVTYHSGFNRIENKYFANIVNSSTVKVGEVVWGSDISGIKGRFTTVKFSIDATTDFGGNKELWSVGSNITYL